MKNKIISIALTLGMILSLLSIAPLGVSAANSVADDFPYMLCNYEDNIINIAGGTIVDGGIGGSKALEVTFAAANDDHLLSDKLATGFNPLIPEGSTLRVSFWVKLSTPATSASFTLISYQMANSGQGTNTDLKNPSSTDWQKITINYTATEQTQVNNTYLRSSAVQTLLIDEFEAVIIPAEVAGKTVQMENLDGYYANYEGNVAPLSIMQSGYWNATKTERDTGDYSSQIVGNPAGDGQAVKITMAATTKGNGAPLYISGVNNEGQWSGLKPPAGTIPNGSTITMRFKYYLGTELSESSAFGFSAKINGTYDLAGENFDKTPNQWNTATLSYTNTSGSAITLESTTAYHIQLQPLGSFGAAALSWVAKGHTGWNNSGGAHDFGTRTVYFDDMEFSVTSAGETTPAANTPSASSNLVVTGEFGTGNKVKFTHTFTPASTSTQGTQDTSIVKILNTVDGLTYTVAYAGINEEITIPELPANGKLSFSVVPIDSEGSVGKETTYTYAQVAGMDASLELLDFEADGSIKACVNVENQKRDGNSICAILTVIMYDAEGGVVKYDTKGIVCANGTTISAESADGQLVVTSDTEDLSQSEIAYAEAYFWDCGTAQLPTIANVKMKELAPDCRVSK